jgi:hypothetical protein
MHLNRFRCPRVGRSLAILFMTVLGLDTVASAQGRQPPAPLRANCDRTAARSYILGSDGPALDRATFLLHWGRPGANARLELEPVLTPSAIPTMVVGQPIQRWDLSQVLDTGSDTVLYVQMYIWEKSFNGENIFNNPTGEFQARLVRQGKTLAFVNGPAEPISGGMAFSTPWVFNTDLLNYLKDHDIESLDQHLGFQRGQQLDSRVRVQRAQDIFKSLGDGKGVVERFMIRCSVALPWLTPPQPAATVPPAPARVNPQGQQNSPPRANPTGPSTPQAAPRPGVPATSPSTTVPNARPSSGSVPTTPPARSN